MDIPSFPVEKVLPAVAASLAANRDVVLRAPPGSGKTTCVPPALLDEPWLEGKKILMLEPRRLAARGAAAHIASKLGEDVGGTVGYAVRLERKVSSRTRLEIVTEGLLEAQGAISDLQRQVRFTLQPSFKHQGKTIRAITYVADFTYVDSDGKFHIVDTKGVKTDVYLLKKKIMQFQGHDIEEV